MFRWMKITKNMGGSHVTYPRVINVEKNVANLGALADLKD